MQINLQEHQQLECTEQDKNYSFVLEDLSSNYKNISAINPIKKVSSLEELDDFLKNNTAILELEDSGFAGYIGYDGTSEIIIYEKILETNSIKKPYHTEPVSIEAEIIKGPAENYLRAIEKCQEYIKEGDIYQANIADKFVIKPKFSWDNKAGLYIYEKLKLLNPSPYAGYLDFENYEIISSSPESFLKITRIDQNWLIESSPIKGTARLNELDQLIESKKEKAEHIMIVDLIRNDLGRICKTGTVQANDIMSIHKFKNLYHYISSVEGILTEENISKDSFKMPLFNKIFAACFPGGSITGTPKKRCMEIIQELELMPRELFTGSMGYFKFNKGGEFNILIRTIIHNKKSNEWSFCAGSGITAYSDSEKELQEVYLKVEKIAEIFGVKL
jgi:anthranilate/para-aminobenzoate synthase component I